MGWMHEPLGQMKQGPYVKEHVERLLMMRYEGDDNMLEDAFRGLDLAFEMRSKVGWDDSFAFMSASLARAQPAKIDGFQTAMKFMGIERMVYGYYSVRQRHKV